MTHSFHILLIVVSLLHEIKWSVSSLYADSSVKLKREASSDGCLLPEHPEHGHYKLLSTDVYNVNTIVAPFTIVIITCDKDYMSDQTTLLCIQRRWEPKFAYCTRTCPSIPQSDTYDVQCLLEGKRVNCENPIQNTIVRIVCRPGYVHQDVPKIPKCSNGIWDQPIQPCHLECGRKIIKEEILEINGTDAEPGEYPWIVGIYNTSWTKEQPICGGSIISKAFVLSAGHCFTNARGVVYNKNWYTLVAGKYHRSLDILEPGAQARKIKAIYVHEDFKGSLTKYRDDIALIEVEKFEITQLVQPVCVDWENRYEQNDFKEGNKAVIAGWTFTTGGSTSPDVLKKVIVPFRSADTCRQFKDKDFFRYYHSTDKICAGYEDQGDTICTGNSGGGLVFRSQPGTYFVRGLLSLAPRSAEGCNSNRYGLFTKVSKYITWLEQITITRL
ncbi:hypothetical protein Trydic_g6692 [Trypoxylus dichotomus]